MKILVLALMLASSSAFAHSSIAEQNKKIVREFYEMTFNQHKPREAADKYFGADYKQHNPFVASGKKPFVDYFEGKFAKSKDSSAEIKRILCEGDMVVVHVHSKENSKDLGRAVVDMFKVEHGKIVEHWDVVQAIPEKSANTNTMF